MKTLIWVTLTAACIAAMLLAGCASAGKNYDSRKVTEIKKGETTETDLIQMFGKPNNRGINSETGTTLTWIYSEARTKGATFIPLVGAFAGGINTKTKMLTVSLDQSGKVATYNYSGGGFDTTSSTGHDPEDGPRTNAPAITGKRQ